MASDDDTSKIQPKLEILWTLCNVSTFSDESFSPSHYLVNLPWKLQAVEEYSEQNEQNLGLYLICNADNDSNFWSCTANVKFSLISQIPMVSNYIVEKIFTFHCAVNTWGFSDFIRWDKLIDNKSAYIHKDYVIVKAEITVLKLDGVYQDLVFDFYDNKNQIGTGVLLIDGKKVYVSKEYLATFSPFFKVLFYSQFAENSMEAIPVGDVDIDEFVELLKVIYPSHASITTANFKYLLELGDKFDMQYVVQKCEDFLIASNISRTDKLKYADMYRLVNLQDACIRLFKTEYAIVYLKENTEEYQKWSHFTKVALFEKLIKLINHKEDSD